MNFLGIDWGKSKIGVSFGSDDVKIASPILILNYKKIEDVIQKLQELIIEENVKAIVVGQPIGLAGEEALNKSYNEFLTLLKELNVEVYSEDERLTTKFAYSLNQKKNKKDDDDLAATIILQSYFDKKK